MAVFLDRDGILNDLVEREGRAVSPRSLLDFRLRDEATNFVEQLRARELRVFVVTNQPDIARGLMRPDEVEATSNRASGRWKAGQPARRNANARLMLCSGCCRRRRTRCIGRRQRRF